MPSRMTNVLGRYRIGERLGGDSLGEAYRAADEVQGRTVTLVTLRPAPAGDAGARDALLALVRPVLSLSHPTIAALFEVGDEDEAVVLAFEYASGDTLRTRLAGTPFNVHRAVDIAVQLADALAEAHGQGVVHYGLSPDSVLITSRGRPKIINFGIAAWRLLTSVQPALQSGTATLAPEDVECLAPEIVLGERGDARADLFSLGCILFEMLTGRQPFSAATAADTQVAILSRTPPPPSQLNARVPGPLDSIVASCLAKSLDLRSDSAATLAAQLREVLADLEKGRRVAEPVASVGRSSKRGRGRLTALVVVFCLAGMLAVGLFLWRDELRRVINRWLGRPNAQVEMSEPG
jgi:serine/threonine protein kinase